jgi:hypothetical protein
LVVSTPLKGEVQLSCQLIKHLISQNVHLSLQGTWLGVIAGMDDRRVGRGGSHADVGILFDQKDIKLVAREKPGHHTPDHTRAYDDDIIRFVRHIRHSFLFSIVLPEK